MEFMGNHQQDHKIMEVGHLQISDLKQDYQII